jgi:predicted amidohydrolase YtcJ
MKADFIFYGGKVHTVDADDRICEAVVVAGDRIVFAGSDADAFAFAGISPDEIPSGDGPRLINLNGKSLVPGLIDSHLHTAVFGANAMAVDCRSPGVSSIDDIKRLIAEAAAKAPAGTWIRGWGYDHSKLKEKRHPNRWDLDEAAPENPVMISRVCAHISTHNSMSLALAGIGDHDDPPADGGAYEKIDGVVSGVMFENAHMNMMKVAALGKDELVDAIETAGRFLISEGITSVHDSGGYGAVQMRAVQEAIETGRMKVRMNMMIFSFVDNLDFVNDWLKVGSNTGLGNDRLRIGPLKIMIDGSSSGPTAATRKPYTSNPDDSGIMSLSQAQIDDVVLRAQKAGWQMTCHAVGDRAIDAMLTAYEKANEACPRKDARHRIEHCAMMTEGLLERVRALGVIPVPQPVFLYEFGDGYFINYGRERADMMFPCASFLRAGVPIAGSSDCPITFSNPMLNIYMAVNRRTQTGQHIGGDESITVAEALRAFTMGGAYASFEEDIKGSIETGKLADLVVLSDDLYAVPSEKIRSIRAELTMIGGEIVYEK